MVELDKNEFKKQYPHLWRELQGDASILPPTVNEIKRDKFSGYTPSIIDYLRRCDSSEQAEKTINYLEGKKEITAEYAEQLRKQLREKGLRSFGAKKEDGYYLRESRET